MPGESEKNDAKSGGKKRTSADKAVASQRVLEDGDEAPPAASASQVQEPNNSEATGTTNCTQLVMFKVRVCAYQFVTMTFASVSGAASMTLMANAGQRWLGQRGSASVGSANGGSANGGSANGGSANGGSANVGSGSIRPEEIAGYRGHPHLNEVVGRPTLAVTPPIIILNRCICFCRTRPTPMTTTLWLFL
jgi:hypothetical protein